MFLEMIMIGLGTAYVTNTLHLDTHESSAGPVLCRNVSVLVDGEVRPAGLFDLIRGLFGAYRRIDDRVYAPRPVLGDVWRCRWCLSFWISLMLVSISSFQGIWIPNFLVMVFGVAGFANLIMVVYDDMQML